MKIAITGSTGLVGSALIPKLEEEGHEIFRLVRKTPNGEHDIQWSPSEGTINAAALEGIDAVVHLAGESIAAGRWTIALKKRIRDSRVDGTTLIAHTLADLNSPPQVLISASAIGYYGDRSDELLDENSRPGNLFLCDICREWEDATDPAREKGIRVVNLRIGVVLSPNGGALSKMLMPFKMCVGGIVGNGKQYWSWIDLDDVVAAIQHSINTNDFSGPVNVVAPNTVTNQEFTKTLGKVLSRPTIFPMPAFAARIALGQMADELLLASTRVEPKKLTESGFEFQYPDLEQSLRHQLSK